MRTIIDWMAFRCRETVEVVKVSVTRAFETHANLGLSFTDRGAGWQGYTSSQAITLGGVQIGLMAYGGANQRGWVLVSLSGVGCGFVSDWVHVQRVLSGLAGFEFRRVDVAFDSVDGKHSYSSVLAAYLGGAFNGNGRRPKHRQNTGDSGDGDTLYIGSRKADKFCRIYEKGKQLAGGRGVTHVDGVRVEDWLRMEVEFKAVTAPIPADIIDNRDAYFAGAYPFFASILVGVEPLSWRFNPKLSAQLELQKALANIKHQYGDTLHTALEAYEGDVWRLFSAISSGEHNAKLVKAGVLMTNHL